MLFIWYIWRTFKVPSDINFEVINQNQFNQSLVYDIGILLFLADFLSAWKTLREQRKTTRIVIIYMQLWIYGELLDLTVLRNLPLKKVSPEKNIFIVKPIDPYFNHLESKIVLYTRNNNSNNDENTVSIDDYCKSRALECDT